MTKVIWKFKIDTTDEQTVRMPKGSEILTIQTQVGIPHIWALCDIEA